MLMLKEYHISLYKFTDNTINDCLPLAMVGSNTFIENEKGQRVRVRKYPWGTVFIENKVSKGCFRTNVQTFPPGTLRLHSPSSNLHIKGHDKP